MKFHPTSNIILVASALFFSVHPVYAQELTPGAGLLFHVTQSNLTIAEKNALYNMLELPLAYNEKCFEKDGITIIVNTYVTDLNKDGAEEVFVQIEENMFSASVPRSNQLFIKNSSGQWDEQTEIGFGMILILATTKGGWPDLTVEKPQQDYTLYRWDGKRYRFANKIARSDIEKGKITPTRPANWIRKY